MRAWALSVVRVQRWQTFKVNGAEKAGQTNAVACVAWREDNEVVDTVIDILAKILVAIAAIGGVGCLLVIPTTAISILRVAFTKDTEQELAEKIRVRPVS
jgi:hypothetical protein